MRETRSVQVVQGTTERGQLLVSRLRTLPAIQAVMTRATRTPDTFRVYAGLWRVLTPDGTVTLHDPEFLAEEALRAPNSLQTWRAQMDWLQERSFFEFVTSEPGGMARIMLTDPVEVLRSNWFLYATTVEELLSSLEELKSLRPLVAETRREKRRALWAPAALMHFNKRRRRS